MYETQRLLQIKMIIFNYFYLVGTRRMFSEEISKYDPRTTVLR